ncbi:MAG TPA: hypothetical protein VK948_06270 [Aeromicrobium sp.]|nr:hypothetical protein [Aeromicrobium sp.]
MPFADPTSCLSCRGVIAPGTGECPHCGVNLNSHEIQQAWRSLQVADQWVAAAKSTSVAGLATPPATATRPAERADHLGDRVASDFAGGTSRGGAVGESRSHPKLTAGTLLLVLGAVALLVAGLIFVTVSWGSMGILGRALTLLGFTAVVGVLAAVMTRRTLRASAESLWAVFLGLLSLDWFAAVGEGLFGLDGLTPGYTVGIWGAVAATAGVVIVRFGRRILDVELRTASITSGAAAGLGAGFLIAEWTADFWWGAGAAGVAAGAMLVLHRARVAWGSRIAGGFAASYALFASASAVFEALENPSLKDLTLGRHGLPLAVVVFAALVVGQLWQRARPGGALVALLASATLMAVPAEHAWPERGAYLVGAVFVGTLGFLVAGSGPWRRGARWASVGAGVLLALWSLPWLVRYAELVDQGAFGPRLAQLMVPLVSDEWSGPGWVALAASAGLAGLLASARRWPEMARFERHVTAAAWTMLGAGVLGAVGTRVWPAVTVAAATLAVGAALAVRNHRAPDGWRHAGPALVVASPVVTMSSWPASVMIWPAAAAMLLALTFLWRDGWLRRAAVFAGTAWAVLSVGALMRWLGYENHWTALALVVAALAALGIAMLLAEREWTHRSAEAGGALIGAFGLLLSAVDAEHVDWLPWTVGGAGVALIGILAPGRRMYIPAGSVLLGIAYILRLADAGVDVVEAYTAPFAVVLLAAGLWAMRKSPSLGTSRALSAGTTLALLPSLPQALDEPASVRSLVLGLVAAGFLFAGTRLRWKVPFVGGAAILLLVVLANIGPWAFAVPRWTLIAVLGGVAIAIGATWESRVRDGRAAVGYISRMR